MRQQTFIMISPYMEKGSGYQKFKNRWRFGWETSEVPEMKLLTREEMQSIIEQHSKFPRK